MRSLRIATITAAALLALASANAGTQHTGGHPMGGRHGAGGMHVHGAAGRPSGTFPHHDGFRHDGTFRHDGRFAHGFHGGQGPWWVADGHWSAWPQYGYDMPVYVAPAPANVWYYCASAAAYYPTVTACPESWLLVVPATAAP